jgi:hypothetical protein
MLGNSLNNHGQKKLWTSAARQILLENYDVVSTDIFDDDQMEALQAAQDHWGGNLLIKGPSCSGKSKILVETILRRATLSLISGRFELASLCANRIPVLPVRYEVGNFIIPRTIGVMSISSKGHIILNGTEYAEEALIGKFFEPSKVRAALFEFNHAARKFTGKGHRGTTALIEALQENLKEICNCWVMITNDYIPNLRKIADICGKEKLSQKIRSLYNNLPDFETIRDNAQKILEERQALHRDLNATDSDIGSDELDLLEKVEESQLLLDKCWSNIRLLEDGANFIKDVKQEIKAEQDFSIQGLDPHAVIEELEAFLHRQLRVRIGDTCAMIREGFFLLSCEDVGAGQSDFSSRLRTLSVKYPVLVIVAENLHFIEQHAQNAAGQFFDLMCVDDADALESFRLGEIKRLSTCAVFAAHRYLDGASDDEKSIALTLIEDEDIMQRELRYSYNLTENRARLVENMMSEKLHLRKVRHYDAPVVLLDCHTKNPVDLIRYAFEQKSATPTVIATSKRQRDYLRDKLSNVVPDWSIITWNERPSRHINSIIFLGTHGIKDFHGTDVETVLKTLRSTLKYYIVPTIIVGTTDMNMLIKHVLPSSEIQVTQ